MQTGEQITLIFAIFTALITLAVVIYYKFCKPKLVRVRRPPLTGQFPTAIRLHIYGSALVMNSLPRFQTGEIITFYMLGFTVFMTVSVVVYYKFIAQNFSGRSMSNLVCRGGRGQRMAKCEEIMNRFVRRRRS
ncbi:unnamed protein product [Heligmosomoides polygyrus]|uniref:Cytochrome n=1 Tax=Heligmosomoides polygyrus TaxID=6339 RepID=A0A3P7YDL4_HELPZ|nr:unnamed protein product [Heligmosomoides polygyrus]